MTSRLKIDFVSDVVLPLVRRRPGRAGSRARARWRPRCSAELHFQPFELNPQMPPEGQDIVEHLHQKYGSTPRAAGATREAIRAARRGRGLHVRARQALAHLQHLRRAPPAALGRAGRRRPAGALKKALLKAYHTDGENPSDPEVLVRAGRRGRASTPQRARADPGLATNTPPRCASASASTSEPGIHSVPAVIINDRHLISGGQPAEVFERALRQIAGAEPQTDRARPDRSPLAQLHASRSAAQRHRRRAAPDQVRAVGRMRSGSACCRTSAVARSAFSTETRHDREAGARRDAGDHGLVGRELERARRRPRRPCRATAPAAGGTSSLAQTRSASRRPDRPAA